MKIQVNRLVTWIWIGGTVITMGVALALMPEGAPRPVTVTRPAR